MQKLHFFLSKIFWLSQVCKTWNTVLIAAQKPGHYTQKNLNMFLNSLKCITTLFFKPPQQFCRIDLGLSGLLSIRWQWTRRHGAALSSDSHASSALSAESGQGFPPPVGTVLGLCWDMAKMGHHDSVTPWLSLEKVSNITKSNHESIPTNPGPLVSHLPVSWTSQLLLSTVSSLLLCVLIKPIRNDLGQKAFTSLDLDNCAPGEQGWHSLTGEWWRGLLLT